MVSRSGPAHDYGQTREEVVRIASNTLLHDEGYSSLATVFNPEFRRLPAEDTLTVAPDVIGSYPYAFYRVEQGALDFATQVSPLIRRECDAVDALLW